MCLAPHSDATWPPPWTSAPPGTSPRGSACWIRLPFPASAIQASSTLPTASFSAPILATGPNVFTPGFTPSLACPAPADGVPGTPVHSSSSGPDISQAIEGLLLKQDEKTNLFQLEYDFTRKFGARLGYRFRHRAIADSDFEQVNEIFYPSNANRGDCALDAGLLPDGCTDNGDGSFTFRTPTPDRDRYRRSSDQRAFRAVRHLGAASGRLASQFRYGTGQRGQLLHPHQPAAVAGISLAYHLPGGQLGEPERLRQRSREAQRCVRGQQSAAQSHVWMERDLRSQRARLPRGWLRLQRRFFADTGLLCEQHGAGRASPSARARPS